VRFFLFREIKEKEKVKKRISATLNTTFRTLSCVLGKYFCLGFILLLLTVGCIKTVNDGFKPSGAEESAYPVVYKAITEPERLSTIEHFVEKNPEYALCAQTPYCFHLDVWGFEGVGFNSSMEVTITPNDDNSVILSDVQLNEIKNFILKNKEYFGVQEESELQKIVRRDIPKGNVDFQYPTDFVYYPGRTGPEKVTVSIGVRPDEPTKATVFGHFWPHVPSKKNVRGIDLILPKLEGVEYFVISGCENSGPYPCDSIATKQKVTLADIESIRNANPDPKAVLVLVQETTAGSEVRYAYELTNGRLPLYVDAVDANFIKFLR